MKVSTEAVRLKTQIFRYVISAGVAALVDIVILIAAIRALDAHYLIAGALGFVGGVSTNYALSSQWVFGVRQQTFRGFAVFALVGMGGLGLTELILYFLSGGLGLSVVFAKIVALGAVFSWNFTLRRKLLTDRPA